MYSFGDTPAFTDWYFRRRAGEVFALLDDQDLVAQIVSVPVSLSIRDAACKAAMLSGITTAPARRREGHMSTLIRESLALLRERGVCAAALYPFDYDYYRRYGFAACGEVARLKVELSRLPGAALQGQILPLRHGSEDLRLLLGAYQACFSQYSGHARRDEAAFSLLLEELALDNGYAAVYRHDGKEEGYLLYYMQDKTIVVNEIGAASHSARLDLLSYLGSHSSSMEDAEFLCPLEDPLWRLLPDPRGAVSAEPYDMLRLVDLGRAMQGLPAAQSAEAGLTLRILDPYAPWNEGLWHFSAHDGALTVKKLPEQEAGPPSDPGAGANPSSRLSQRPAPGDDPVLTIGELTQWAFGCASGRDLILSGAALTEAAACAMDALLVKQPFFLYEMY